MERGDFEGDEGAYRLKGGIDSIPLPPTVQAVVAARIDRLEGDAKEVLEVASVTVERFRPQFSRWSSVWTRRRFRGQFSN